MKNSPAITVSNVSKDFKLPHKRKNSIKSLFTGMFEKGGGVKSYESQHALKNISFNVEQGEFFGIVGRNGSGKSTLLKLLAGIYQPTNGTISVEGRLVPFIELGVGFNPELTGRENVFLNGALLGFSVTEIEKMYEEIVEFAELEKFMDQKLKNYSSGMQVRLAFSMAVRARADVLLIDEVLAVGDADFQRKCFDYFRELKRVGTTVVFVSHDMNAVVEYCDRALLIDKSNIIDSGKPEDIAKKYNRLFEKPQSSSPAHKKTKRWGDASVTIDSTITDNEIYHADEDNEIAIEITVKAEIAIDHNISIGFLIKNASGVTVLGTNTHESRKILTDLKQGEIIKAKWFVPNIFGDGKYIVDAAVTTSDGSTTHDWVEDISEFRVFRQERSPYLVTPTIPLEISR